MEFVGINYLAIGAAAVTSFIFGALWYGTLGKVWMTAAGLSEEDTKPKPLIFVMTFVCQLVMAWVLAGLVGHLGENQVTLSNAIISALFVWVGFVLVPVIVNYGFQGKPIMLTIVDGGHWLGVLLVQATVIGLIGVSVT